MFRMWNCCRPECDHTVAAGTPVGRSGWRTPLLKRSISQHPELQSGTPWRMCGRRRPLVNTLWVKSQRKGRCQLTGAMMSQQGKLSASIAVYLWCCRLDCTWTYPQWCCMEEGLGWAHVHAEEPCLHRQHSLPRHCTLWLGLHAQSTTSGSTNATWLTPTERTEPEHTTLNT